MLGSFRQQTSESAGRLCAVSFACSGDKVNSLIFSVGVAELHGSFEAPDFLDVLSVDRSAVLVDCQIPLTVLRRVPVLAGYEFINSLASQT